MLMLGCKNNNYDDVYIDLKSIINTEKSINLSALADSISYIQLETSDDCLLPENIAIIHMDSTDVFVVDNKCIYRFSSNGTFKNRIGRIGGGPEEYPQLLFTIVDPVNKLIFILTHNNVLFFYNYDGHFIKKIKLQGEIKSIDILNNNEIVCTSCDYENGFSAYLLSCDYDGNLLNKYLLEKDDHSYQRTMHTSSISYSFHHALRIKSPHNDTIFQYNNNGISKHKVLSLGKYSPTRELVEDVNRKHELYANYVQILAITESDNYLFLLAFKNNIRGIIVEKANHNIVFNKEIENPKKGGGIHNDVDGLATFWPMMYCYKNAVARIVHPSYIYEKSNDENPLIQIVYLKNIQKID
jgi:hypothetical protein